MTLDEFVFSKYFPWCESTLRRSTVVGYESAYRLHISPYFGSYEIEEIEVEHIEFWLANFKRSGAAIKAYAVLRAILRKAYKWLKIKYDATLLDIEKPRRYKYQWHEITDRQAYDLLNAIYGEEWEPIVLCSYTLGLRRGESCGLTWGDINLKTGMVNINKSRQYIKGQVVIEEPKTPESLRMRPLPKFALRRLRELSK